MTYQRRTVGIVAALVLALLGTLGLVGYVQGAKNDAVAGEKRVRVYVATDRIPAGTPVNRLADKVSAEKVPAKVRVDHAVTSLKSVKGEVTSIDVLPGEQLVTSRFVPATATANTTAKGVPAGMFGATVSLDPEQALGGQVRAGDRVAIVGITTNNGVEADTASMIASNVLITSVQIDGSNGDNPKQKEVTSAPTGKFFVTFALSQADLEKVVSSANGGRIWLAADPTTTGAAQ
ncbi:MAG: Flp pilus assembly protein CpaB [Acidimicrobiia bacterium]